MSDDQSNKTPLKEYLDGLNQRMVAASTKVGNQISVASKQVGNAAKRAVKSTKSAAGRTTDAIKSKVDDAKAARQAKKEAKNPTQVELSGVIPIEDGGVELPSAPKLPELMDSVDMATPYSLNEIRLSRDEYNNLTSSLNLVADQQAQIEVLMGDIQSLTNQLVNLEEVTNQFSIEDAGSGSLALVDISGRSRGMIKAASKRPVGGLRAEMSQSFNDSLTLLGFSVAWLAALIGADYYVTQQGWVVEGFSADVITWSVGTTLWSLAVLTRLHTARTFLAMPWGMRIQSAFGVGLATTMALLLTKEQYSTIGNVWGWGATIALTALLLSGMARGLVGSTRSIFGSSNKQNPEVPVIDVSSESVE